MDEHTQQLIAQAYRKRLGVARLSKRFNVSKEDVVEALRINGLIQKYGPRPGSIINPEASAEIAAKVLELDALGWDVTEIVRELNISTSRAYYILVNNGVHRSKINEEKDEEEKAQIKELYAQGLDHYEIAEIVGVSRTTVRRRLAEMGVERRGTGLSNNPQSRRFKAILERNKKICEDAEVTPSARALGEKYNLSHERIKDILADNGVSLRIIKRARKAQQAQQEMKDGR